MVAIDIFNFEILLDNNEVNDFSQGWHVANLPFKDLYWE